MRKYLTISLYAFVTLAPLLMGLGYSLLYSLGLIGLLNEGFTLEHWQKLFSSSDALNSLWYSSWLTIMSLLLTLALALAVSWQYVRYTKRGVAYKSLVVPLLFPPLIAGFAWFYILSPGGILSRLAYQLGITSGIEQFPRMVNDYWSAGIITAHVFIVFPLFTLLFIEQNKKERMAALLQSAFTLGSTRWQFFRRIYTPMLLSRTQSVIWLYGIFLLGTYEVPIILGQSTQRPVTIFITEKLTRYNLNDIPVAHATAVLYTVFVLLVVSLFVRKKAINLI